MGWEIKCLNKECKEINWASNIVELITKHRNEKGYFLCKCGNNG